VQIALGQTVGTPADIAANLRLMERLAEQAAADRAALLVLPELFLTGYNIGAAVAALAEPCNGPSAEAIAAIARRLGLCIAYGYPERTADGVYNSAAVIDRNGRLLANYRKIHLWGDFESTQFRPGRTSELFELDGQRLGLMICYDLDFPELARSLALAGADGAITISATTVPYTIVPRQVVPTRAYENSMFVVFANRAGEEHGQRYTGESCIAGPDGSILLSCGETEMLATVDLAPARYADYRREHRYMQDRRPELYRL
jgi:predicted amidohydrolase